MSRCRHHAAVALALSVLALPAGADAQAQSAPEALAVDVGADAPPARAVQLTRRALQLSGIGVIDADSGAVDFGRSPRSGVNVMQAAVVGMAFGARSATADEGVTLVDVAEMLRRAGASRRSATPAAVARLLRDLVSGARRHRRDPYAFGPLFLAELAEIKAGGVDLDREFTAEEVRLSGLELQILIGTIHRGLSWRTPPRARPAAAAPCTLLKQGLNAVAPLLGDIVELKLKKEAPGWFARAIEKFTGVKVGATRAAKALKKVAGPLGLISKAVAWGAFYSAAKPRVTVDRERVSKPEPGSPAGDLAVTSSVGLRDEDAAAWEAQWGSASTIADCARSLGLDIPPLGAEAVRDLDKWRVRVTIEERGQGPLRHLRWSSANPPPLGTQGEAAVEYSLERRSEHLGERRLIVNVLPESGAEHAGGLDLDLTRIRAELLADEMPGLVELLTETVGAVGTLFMKMYFLPRGEANPIVEWGHCGSEPGRLPQSGTRPQSGIYVGGGLSGPGNADPEQERFSSGCDRFEIRFEVRRGTVADFSVSSFEWTCEVRRNEDAGSPPPRLGMPYFKQPGGYSMQRRRVRDGSFGWERSGRFSLPGGRHASWHYSVRGVFDGQKARGTFQYTLRYTPVRRRTAQCSTGGLSWEASRG